MRGSRVFLAAQATSGLGDGLALLAIPLLVLRLTRSPVAAVLASLPASAGYLAAGLPAGVLVDRMNPRLVLASGDVIRAGLFLILFAVTGRLAAGPWVILSLAFAAGVVTVFSDTAVAIVVRDVFTGPHLVSANSMLESATQTGQILGPGGAGLLAAAGLLRTSLLIDALTFLVSLAGLAGLRSRYPAGPPPDQPGSPARPPLTWRAARGELAEGFRQVAATRLLRALLLFVLVLNLCLGADKLVIFLLRTTLALPPWHVGLIVSAGGLGGLAGAAGTGWLTRRIGPVGVITLCCAASGAALLLLGAAGSVATALAGNVLYTWAVIAASVTLRSLRQALVPRPLLGRVTASWRLCGQAATLTGGLLAGAGAALAGSPRPVFATAGALTLVTVTAAWFTALRHEDGGTGLLIPPEPDSVPPA